MGCEASNDQLNIKPPQPKDNKTTNEDQDEDNSVFKAGRGEIIQQYRFSKVIFRSSAIIRYVIDYKDETLRICKILSIDTMRNLLRAHQQLQILRNLNHPNIVQLIQSFSENNFLYIILENIAGKSLSQYLSDRQLLHFPVMVEVIRQILTAIKFCHERGYVHRGINMDNIILTKLGEGKGYQVKVVGFGQALRIGARPLGVHNTNKSSFYFPSGSETEQMIQKQDVWGCGIILLQIISGQRKFSNFKQRKNEIIESVSEKQDCSDDFKEVIKDFLLKMLQGSSKKRFTAEEALEHKIFSHSFPNVIRVKRNSARDIEKWLNFRIKSNLSALTSMYHNLTIDQQQKNTEQLIQFYNLDKDKDGKINVQEFVEGIQNTFSMEHTSAQEHATKVYSLLNKNSADNLQIQQYISAMALLGKEVYEKSLLKIFKQLDTNRDGRISLQEFKNSIEGMDSSISLKKYENESLDYTEYKELMLNFFQEQKNKQEK